jgi:hypothetical protein
MKSSGFASLPYGFAGLGLLGLAIAACSGGTATSQTSEALSAAQCTFLANREAADACRDAFTTCVAQPSADVAACLATLELCLPPPPDAGVGHHGGHHGPPPLDGGFGPPPVGEGPGMGPDCQHDGGQPPPPHGRGGHPGEGPGPMHPDAAAITACRDALQACLAATPTSVSCLETQRTCERAAFVAPFAAACAGAPSCTVTSDPACAELQERCSEGVDGRPGAFDGGTCP